MVKVKIGEETYKYPLGTTYREIAAGFQEKYPHEIVLVQTDENGLQELNKTPLKDCSVSFVTTADPAGFETYRRSASLLLVKAVRDVSEPGEDSRVWIHFSLGAGFYCTLEGGEKPDEAFLARVSERMKELVGKCIPIQKTTIHTAQAMERFHAQGMYDKERLFRYRRVAKVNVYTIEDLEDYYYGYMVPDTGYLKYFALYPYEEGFVLQMPTQEKPEEVPPFAPWNKLFCVLNASKRWGSMQQIDTAGALNDRITGRDMQETVLVEEAHQERQICEIAGQIADRPETKFILIAGPSSSGKTTFSHRLSIQLKVNGLVPHPIAVDNYFVDREKTPRDANGEYDFECLEAIDTEKFNRDMDDLLNGKAVCLPVFNFKTGKREYEPGKRRLAANDILVIEGIHCLNPKLSESLSDENKFRIYISALTQLNVDEHNRIPSTDGRLIRRIVRDARTRGSSAARTIHMWPSVRRGEERNIFPFQENADRMFDSSLSYELAVLKQYVEPLLFGVPADSPAYTEAKRLLKFLDYFVGIGSEHVPTNSLLREFIGGGCFRV